MFVNLETKTKKFREQSLTNSFNSKIATLSKGKNSEKSTHF